jgi:Lipopolysaccharide kinase (Kdo/WaaP) family
LPASCNLHRRARTRRPRHKNSEILLIFPPVSPQELEQTLRKLSAIGQRVETRSDVDIWRFAFGDRSYDLLFYRRETSLLKRLKNGNAALRSFFFMQQLQKASVPSPRAVAVLQGFRIDGKTGDALIAETLEPAISLDRYVQEHSEQCRQLARQVCAILRQIGQLKFGHRKLELRSFVVRDGTVYIRDAENIRARGLRTKDLMRLEHSARRWLSRSELLRCWLSLDGGRLPPVNTVSEAIWKLEAADAVRSGDYVGLISDGDWSGAFTRKYEHIAMWSIASNMNISEADWQTAWPELLRKIESDQLEIIKRDDSGDVLGAEILLGGQTVPIVVKRPRRKSLLRYLIDVFRPSRARRTWIKCWKMLLRDISVEWPMLLMEKRRLGYVTDAIVVFERVAGPVLARMQLDSLDPSRRDQMFRRIGRTLRRIEELGFTHFDAKSTNWIIFDDPVTGPTPVMLDLDGVRHYRWKSAGILRLLRAMKQHPQYTPTDSLALCQGYAPRAAVIRKEAPPRASVP